MYELSVCIPVFHPEMSYLRNLVASVPASAEIVMSVDGDKHRCVERLLKEELPVGRQVTVIYNKEPKGMAQNWNAAVQESLGEYVIVPGQDDVLDAQVLEQVLSDARSKRVALVIGNVGYINASDEYIRRRSLTVGREDVFDNKAAYQLSELQVTAIAVCYGQVFADPCGMVFSRQIFDAVGGFSTQFQHAVDLEFIIRVALKASQILVLPNYIALRRLHKDNLTSRHIQEGLAREDRRLLADHYLRELKGLPSGKLKRVRNRARARVFTHALYDAVKVRKFSVLVEAVALFRPGLICCMIYEILENLRLIRPVGRRWARSLQ